LLGLQVPRVANAPASGTIATVLPAVSFGSLVTWLVQQRAISKPRSDATAAGTASRAANQDDDVGSGEEDDEGDAVPSASARLAEVDIVKTKVRWCEQVLVNLLYCVLGDRRRLPNALCLHPSILVFTG